LRSNEADCQAFRLTARAGLSLVRLPIAGCHGGL
jgi:hypothetical protein